MSKKIALLLVVSLLFSVLPAMTFAQSSERMIRVALLLDSGGALNTTKPFATLSSTYGLQIGSQDGLATYATTGSHPIRLSLNQYRILIDETKDLLYADALVQRLAQLGQTAYITTLHRKNVAYYRVVAGDEPTNEMAMTKLQQLKNQVGVAREVLGPLALTAGVYALEADARDIVQAIVDAGFDAHVGITIDNGGTTGYAVVVGNEATDAERTSLWQEVSLTFPNYSFEPLATDKVITQMASMRLGAGNPQLLTHYYVPATSVVRVRPLAGDDIPTITFIDKDNRKYRGEMEVLSHRGRLALVNELPFEQYLYAVVGTEMATGWPLEALKVQAVIARTYALGKGNRYGIAHISDTTYDQAYYGISREAEDVRRAVQETAGLVLRHNGKLIEAYYYSNAGGMTAIGAEVWGNDVPYLRSVTSPDEIPHIRAADWHYVVRENGQYGYIRSDLVESTWERNPNGFAIVRVLNDNTNFRSDPSTAKAATDKLMLGERLTVIETVKENNAYAWVEGPFDGVAMMNLLNTRATAAGNVPHTRAIDSLKVTARGPSGRVLSMSANNLPVVASSPDGLRTVLGSIRSTMFDIEERGRFTIVGADGKTTEYPQMNEPLMVLSAGNTLTKASDLPDELLLYGNGQDVRVVTMTPSFRIHGKGYGHGLGLSQWGARGLAEQGYSYEQILRHYFSDSVMLQPIE